MRTYARAAFAGVTAAIALAATVPLTGCSGGKGSLGTVPVASRAQGKVTLTVVWPQRTRLIPDASNSIVVRLNRIPDEEIPTPKTVDPVTLRRPNPGQPLVTTATFTDLELGRYNITATAYPGNNGPATPNPNTGENVPVATKTSVVTVTAGNNTATVTMDTTIDRLVPDLPLNFPRTNEGLLLLLPGGTVRLSAIALDATPDTATPPGPYRVLISRPLQYAPKAAADARLIDVAADGTVTVIAPANLQVQQRATVVITEPESGKTSEVTVVIAPRGLSVVAQVPRFRYNSRNTGQAPRGNPISDNGATLTEAETVPGEWPFITSNRIVFSSPVIAQDGTIYIGSVNRNGSGTSGQGQKLYAIRPNGSFKWEYDDEGRMGDIEATPTLGQDGTIYFGSMNGIVYAIRDVQVTGTSAFAPQVAWRRPVGGPVFASAALSENNTLYVGTTEPDSKLYALNAVTGQPIRLHRNTPGDDPVADYQDWVYTEATGGIYTAPALSDDGQNVYIGSQDGIAYGVRTTTDLRLTGGTLRRWRSPLNSGLILASCVVTRINGQAAVIVASQGGRVFALTADTGVSLWTPYDAGGQVLSTPAVRENGGNAQTIYVATLDNVSGNFDHKVVGLNAGTGAEIWRTPVNDPADVDNNGVTDEPLFNDGFTSSPSLTQDGSLLYIGGFDGALYGIRTAPGATELERVEWRYATTPVEEDPAEPTNNLESSPAINRDGVVYIGGYDGKVYAVRRRP